MRVKRRIFSGTVCEQMVFSVKDNADLKSCEPKKPRFKTEAEREKHREQIARKKHLRMFNATFSPSSLYSTLTFNQKNECHDYIDAKILRERFIRKLQRRFPAAVICLYMGRGESTGRIHFHMVSEGIPADELKAMWIYGEVTRIDPLRKHNYYNGVDYGTDYQGLANYLFNHWEPAQGRYHYRKTRNTKSPETEAAKEIKREYAPNKPPRAPKGYILIEVEENDYGYICFRYIVKPEPEPRKERGRKRREG